MHIYKKQFLTTLIIFLYISATAQKNKNVTTLSGSIYADSALLSTTKFRLIGPFRGGRSAAVAGCPKSKNTFYMGSTGGGVWKTLDGGSNWKNMSDKYFGGSIGAVSVAPSDPTIVYAGEGEGTLRGNVSEGINGIWRSDDAGRSWTNLGLKETRHIVRIVIHPKNPDIVWVAAIGHLFGSNAERGVIKTTDGGKNWQKVLFVNEQTGCSDLTMEPGNPQVLYAGMWRVKRTPYSFESGGDGSGLYKSTDGGTTWVNISAKKGLPKGTWGIVGVAVAPSNTDKIYTLIENEKGGLFVSNDAGETFTLVSNDNNIRQRAWYYSKVYVDPKNENTVYCPNVEFMRSKDGGKTFQSLPTPHGDHHDLWIDNEDPQRMIVADDGGAQISFDGAANWSSYLNQPTAQFYRVSTDNSFPYKVLGAQQDNTSVRIKSRTYGSAITEQDWEPTAGFESGYMVADPLNPEIVYGGNYGGYLSRLDHKTSERRAISVWPESPIGAGADVQKFRFQWNFPIFFSPHNPKRLYAAGNHLFVTENEGQSWQQISPDLTTNNKNKQAPSGGAITKDNTGVEYYCTIFTAAESPIEKGLLWTGSDDGLVYLTKNNGANWLNVTPKNAPENIMWNCVEISPFKKGTAWLIGTCYKSNNYKPYIFYTEDYGTTWSNKVAGIDPLHFTRCLRADPNKEGILYAGTEYGLYISNNNGNNWTRFQLNLPQVSITDMTIKNNDLIVATQGRSFWILDDLTTVQQMNANTINKNLFVYKANNAWRMEGSQNKQAKNAGFNPPNGVMFNYWLKNVIDSPNLSITIFDKQKKIIRTYSTKASDEKNKIEIITGMNQFVWNMEYPPVDKIEGMILWSGNINGPKAAPGNYVARFVLANDSADVPFTILADPNYNITEAQYDEQVGFLLTIKEKFSDIQKAIKQIRGIRQQVNDVVNRVDTLKYASLKIMGDSINKKITRIEETLYQTKAKSGQDVLNYPIRLNDKISGLFDYVNSGYNAPSQQAKESFADLASQTDVQLKLLSNVMENEIKLFNEKLHQEQVPVISWK